jgi:8-oxo-dGTP pyrophosphatase MutT (NUDIX family)
LVPVALMTREHTLLEQLQTYEPAERLEDGFRRRMVDLLTGSPLPFSRSSFAPGHFTAGCFIVDADGRLLLHHHRRLGIWVHMGGHVEGDETSEAAALREAAEESGLADLELLGGIFDLDVHAIPAGRGEPDHDHFDVRYLARAADPNAIRIDRGESNELAWVPTSRAAELMPRDAGRVIRKIERVLRERSLS